MNLYLIFLFESEGVAGIFIIKFIIFITFYNFIYFGIFNKLGGWNFFGEFFKAE